MTLLRIMADRISVHNNRTVSPSLYTVELWVEMCYIVQYNKFWFSLLRQWPTVIFL